MHRVSVTIPFRRQDETQTRDRTPTRPTCDYALRLPFILRFLECERRTVKVSVTRGQTALAGASFCFNAYLFCVTCAC